MDSADGVGVVVVAPLGPGRVLEKTLRLPAGATVADAVRASGFFLDLEPAQWPACGIWGRGVNVCQVVCDNDRVELYRPLKIDPKTARRERFARQGVRTAGLFAR